MQRADGAGRAPAVEIMITTGRIRNLILEPTQTDSIQAAVREGDFYGMQSFDQSLLQLYETGVTTLEEAVQVATNPHDFKLLVKSKGYEVSLMD